jgi:hypothetical protein
MTLSELLQDNLNEEDGENESDTTDDLSDVVIIPSWEDLVKEGIRGEMMYQPSSDVVKLINMEGCDTDNSCFETQRLHQEEEDHGSVSGQTVSMVSKRQGRIDQLLKVSGFSQDDAARDLELYYFQKPSQQMTHEDEDDPIEEEEDDGANDDHDEDKNSIERVDKDIDDLADDHEEYEKDGILSDHDASVSVAMSALTLEQKEALLTAVMNERLRAKVTQQVQRKNELRQRTSRNFNKKFVKGKRVYSDYSPEY